MSSAAEKLKNNKSIAILDAAERGGYGVVSVVCVCNSILRQGNKVTDLAVQPRRGYRYVESGRVTPLTGYDSALPLGSHPVQVAPRESRCRCVQDGDSSYIAASRPLSGRRACQVCGVVAL